MALSRILATTAPALAKAVGTLFPARCAACHEPVGAHGALCAACWGNIHFIADPVCCRCGLPFAFAMTSANEQVMCGRCMAQSPAYAQARSIFRYDEHSKAPVLAFKYYDKTQLAPTLGGWLARLAKLYQPKVHVVVPVPLHYWRLVRRRYNQAAMLAQQISRQTGLAMLPDTLLRIRDTPQQSGLSRRQREDNMRGAFAVPQAKRPGVKGKSVLLVDDVMTTGATLDACARALHDAGAMDVYVVTLARTVLTE